MRINNIFKFAQQFLYEDLTPYRSSRLHQEYEQFSNVEFPFDDIIRVQDISQTFWGSAADAVGYIQSMSTFQTFRAVNLREADKLLHNYQYSILDILESNTTPERTPLAYRKDYFLILCRRRRTENKNLK
ncbi:hypothetical protein AVEN_153261-1 [Araneus ventricosus]|uniref:Uncharacterized protein n=1 Tax=Araneus ventricosus TaxID=182803 RepID=A0A4Y2K3L9_ARAVE|nr:hypothetical protein AVEN_153261-1 [Araneus ventricosus]